MGSYGDQNKDLAVYLDRELKDSGVNPLDKAGRTAAFQGWVERMLLKDLKME